MIQFTILFRRADHADAISMVIDAADIDVATDRAIQIAQPDEYVVGVWQLDTPAEIVSHHAHTQFDHYLAA